MTAQEMVLDLLQYIGVYGFQSPGANSLNESSSDEADVVKAVAAVNAALQEVYSDGPDSLRHRKRAQFFHQPTPITLTAGQGIVLATATTTLPTWMKGCSILIAGDGDLNEITAIDGANLTLLRGYIGAGAAGILATVYSDAAVLDADIEALLEPVEITPNIKLRPAQSRTHFDHLAYSRQDYDVGGLRGNYTSGTNKQIGIPTLYLAEDQIDQQLVLRLNPMPPSNLNVTFNCQLAPQVITRKDDIDEEGDTDPGTEFTSIPSFMVESILLPIARQKFFTHPALKNNEARGAVQAEYSAAKLSLTTKPRRSVHAVRARYT